MNVRTVDDKARRCMPYRNPNPKLGDRICKYKYPNSVIVKLNEIKNTVQRAKTFKEVANRFRWALIETVQKFL